MFSSALKVLALAAVALALPATESTDTTAVSEVGTAVEVPEVSDAPVITLCNGEYPLSRCIDLPTNNGVCFNIPTTGPPWVVGVRVPRGFICILFRPTACSWIDNTAPHRVILNPGVYNLDRQLVVTDLGDLVNFSRRAMSYTCWATSVQ